MNIDSYSEIISEDKMNIVVDRVLALDECVADKNTCRCHISRMLHETFCPCILSGCPTCDDESLNGQPVSRIENGLVTEIMARVHRVKKNDLSNDVQFH